MAISKQVKLFGDLIVHFVNAETTDEALSSLYSNFQKAFKLSPDFPEKAKSVFPTTEYYRSQFSTLLFQRTEDEYEGHHQVDRVPIGEPFWVSIDDIKEKFDSFSCRGSLPEEFDDHVTAEVVIEDIRKLMRVSVKLKKKKKQYSSDIISEYEKQIKGYKEFLAGHSIVDNFQKAIKGVLEDFCNKKPFSDKKSALIANEYSYEFRRVSLLLLEEGALGESMEAYEKWLLRINEKEIFSYRICKLKTPVRYAFAESLLTPERLKHLKQCEYCGNYFIAKRLIENQRFCPDCSPKNKMTKEERKEYMRDYRPKRKKMLVRKKREETIQRYMRSGDTREQAELRIDNEREV